METATKAKVRKARIIGSGYFILLALINLVISMSAGYFEMSFIYILLIVSVPLLFNKRQICLWFGILYFLVWSYVGMAIMVKGINDPVAIVVLPIVTLFALFCSMLLVYAGVTVSKKEFSLI